MGKKVLIADYDESHLKKLRELLGGFDIEIEEVSTGTEALKKLRENDYVMAILSTMLPGINGFELTKKLRIELGLSRLPVLLVSSIYRGARYKYEALHIYGADEFFEFPLNEEEILGVFKKHLPIKEVPASTVRMSILDLKEDTSVKMVGSSSSQQTGKKEGLITTEELFGDLLKEVEAEEEKVEEKPEFTEDIPSSEPEEEMVSEEEIIDEMEEEPEEIIEEAKEEAEEVEELIEEPEEIEEAIEEAEPIEELKEEIIVSKEEKAEARKKKEEKAVTPEPEFRPEEILEEIFATKKEKPKKKKVEEEDLIDKILEETLSGMGEKKKKIRDREAGGKKKEERPEVKPAEVKKEVPVGIEVEKPPEKEKKKAEKVEEERKPKVETPRKEEEKIEEKIVMEEEPFGTLEEEKALGEYILIEKISTGGMAEVYKAKKKGVEGFEKVVALKRILPHLAEDEEFIKMFIDEAKVASRLNHPNIAQIYDLGKIDGSYFIAMEYVLGKDLKTILRKIAKEKKALPPLDISSYIVMKIAEALDYAHRKVGEDGKPLNIVHRDVSPQNILISYEGEVKLVDFGVAKASIRAHHTVTGSLKGKLLYMSPEQARSGKVDNRSDIFSLGSVYYELVTGIKAFMGGSEAEVLDKVRKGKFVPPRQFNPDLPDEVERIILKAMEIDPSSRYQNASEMRNDIEKFLLSYRGSIPSARDVAVFMYSLFKDEIKSAGIEVEIIKEKPREQVVVEKVKAPVEVRDEAPERKKEEKKREIKKKEVEKGAEDTDKARVRSFGFEKSEVEVEEIKKKKKFPVGTFLIVLILIGIVAGGLFYYNYRRNLSLVAPVPEEVVQEYRKKLAASEEIPQEGITQEKGSQGEVTQPQQSPETQPGGNQESPQPMKIQQSAQPQVNTPPVKKTTPPKKQPIKVQSSVKPVQSRLRTGVKAQPAKPVSQPQQKPAVQKETPPPAQTQPEVKKTPPVQKPVEKKQTVNQQITKPVARKPAPVPQKPVIREGSLVPFNMLDIKPKPKKKVPPKKPSFPRKSGLITLMVLVSPQGKVEQVRVIRGLHPKYDEAARQAVMKWVFTTPMKEGKKVRTWTVITIKF